MALRRLCHFLREAESAWSEREGELQIGLRVLSTQDLPKPPSKWSVYARPNFVLKDLEHVSQCAYFDYQRERVYIRTDKRFKQINKRFRRKRLPFTPNRQVEIVCETCPHCSSRNITRKYRLKRKTVDLKFFRGGVKKWIVQYVSWGYRCEQCETYFISDQWQTNRFLSQPGLVR